MAIHYATGTAATAHAWLAAIRDFVIATLGWSEDHWSTDGNITRFHCHVGADQHASWDCRTAASRGLTAPRVQLYRCTGYTAENAYDAQPGSYVAIPRAPYTGAETDNVCEANGLSGADMGYWLFGGTGADGDYCHAVIELAPAQYASLHCGELAKCCAFDGGSFCDCAQREYVGGISYDTCHIPFATCLGNSQEWRHGGWLRAEMDGAAAPYWYSFQSLRTPLCVNAGNAWKSIYSIVDRFVVDLGSTALNMQAVLWPISVFGPRPEGYWSALGNIPGVRKVDLEFIAPQTALNYGDEIWMAFPALMRSAVPSWNDGAQRTSGYFGYAYRRA